MTETETVVGTGLRITCSKDELVQALGVVSRAVSTRTSVQILSGILLEAANNEQPDVPNLVSVPSVAP